ncbi:MAG TPA: dihydrofolate reductase family protein, partial [Anaerolineales bacterium]|nr:dihydrofolate reductase family protein [Anaerolineales bacterium]
PFNGFKKFVVSSTLKSADAWRDSTLIRGNVIEEVRKLKSQPGKNIIMDGSSVLVQALIEHDLVDELSLHVYPLVLGGGKRMFPAGKRVSLNLIESSALPTGVVYQRFQLT